MVGGGDQEKNPFFVTCENGMDIQTLVGTSEVYWNIDTFIYRSSAVPYTAMQSCVVCQRPSDPQSSYLLYGPFQKSLLTAGLNHNQKQRQLFVPGIHQEFFKPEFFP